MTTSIAWSLQHVLDRAPHAGNEARPLKCRQCPKEPGVRRWEFGGSLLVHAVLGLWPTVSSWAHSPNGWLDPRHTAGTPTGPATPATGFGTLFPFVLFPGSSAEARSWRCCVSVCWRRDASAGSPAGFSQTLHLPHL